MIRVLLLALALAFVFAAQGFAPPAAEASETKSQTKKKQTAKKGRSDYTPEQREKIMERARQVCRDEFGKPSRVYRIDYRKMRVYCYLPSAG
jgi:hypothetical protein